MDFDASELCTFLLALITLVCTIIVLKKFSGYRRSAIERRMTKGSLPRGALTFDAIVNEFLNIKEVSCALRKAGLEKCQLILGIDFTASNEWQGRKTFSQKSLHAISEKLDERYGRRGSMHHLGIFRENPYQKVISVLGQTLEPLDDDQLIPAFGFGDTKTKDNAVFSLSGLTTIHINYEDNGNPRTQNDRIDISAPETWCM